MSENKPDYLILVNKHHRLPDHFEDTIELISVENAEGLQYTIEKRTYEAFLALRADLLTNDGIQAELISVYRKVEAQERIFKNYTAQFGLDYAKKYAAKPGHSEHHTGLAIDVGFMLDGKVTHGIAELLKADHLFRIVHKKLPKYGFLLRYPEGKEAVTEIGYEPWHFRYIDSPEIAKELTDKGLCFEEYYHK